MADKLIHFDNTLTEKNAGCFFRTTINNHHCRVCEVRKNPKGFCMDINTDTDAHTHTAGSGKKNPISSTSHFRIHFSTHFTCVKEGGGGRGRAYYLHPSPSLHQGKHLPTQIPFENCTWKAVPYMRGERETSTAQEPGCHFLLPRDGQKSRAQLWKWPNGGPLHVQAIKR